MIKKEAAYELLHSDDFDMGTFLASAPVFVGGAIHFYEDAFEAAEEEIIKAVQKVREMSGEGISRKEIAGRIKADPYSAFCFASLDDADKPAEEIIKEIVKIQIVQL